MRKNRIKMITLLVLMASASSVLFFSKSELQNAKKLLKDDLLSYTQWSLNVPVVNGTHLIYESFTDSNQGPGEIKKVSCSGTSSWSITISNFSSVQKGSEYEISGSVQFPLTNAVGANVGGSFQFTTTKTISQSQSFTLPVSVPANSQVDRMTCYYTFPTTCNAQNESQACNTYYLNQLKYAVENL